MVHTLLAHGDRRAQEYRALPSSPCPFQAHALLIFGASLQANAGPPVTFCTSLHLLPRLFHLFSRMYSKRRKQVHTQQCSTGSAKARLNAPISCLHYDLWLYES